MSNNLEYCFKCDEPTGCAGRADDSHYNEDGEGPFCWRCWCEDENPRLHEQIEQLQSALATSEAEAKAGRELWVEAQAGRKKLRLELDTSEADNERLRDEVEFWMGEGDGSEWPPENMAWRKLFDISKDQRTPEQVKEMGRLATVIRWKGDEKIQYERAERLREALETACGMLKHIGCQDCGGDGVIVDGDGEQNQCQWCYYLDEIEQALKPEQEVGNE